jgi:hypothetical protein
MARSKDSGSPGLDIGGYRVKEQKMNRNCTTSEASTQMDAKNLI